MSEPTTKKVVRVRRRTTPEEAAEKIDQVRKSVADNPTRMELAQLVRMVTTLQQANDEELEDVADSVTAALDELKGALGSIEQYRREAQQQ